jgi:hypothetical protein
MKIYQASIFQFRSTQATVTNHDGATLLGATRHPSSDHTSSRKVHTHAYFSRNQPHATRKYPSSPRISGITNCINTSQSCGQWVTDPSESSSMTPGEFESRTRSHGTLRINTISQTSGHRCKPPTQKSLSAEMTQQDLRSWSRSSPLWLPLRPTTAMPPSHRTLKRRRSP